MNTLKIVIVGGGFAGINLLKQLAKNKRFLVTLVDKNNYHFFPPLLYQVSTAFIDASNICYPFRRMFQNKENIRFHNGSLVNINVHEKKIETDNGVLCYDYLVLAMGTETNYFGMQNVKEHSLPMKTIDDSLQMRNRLLLNLEEATREKNKKEKGKLTNIVIAGAGPTGVELAGMLAEMSRNIQRKDYPELNQDKLNIYLVDMAESLLNTMSPSSQQEARKTLERLGVHIELKAAVKDYVDEKVLLSNGKEIMASVLIWASGVIGREAPGLPEESIGRGRRIIVDEYNQVRHVVNIFAIGDICLQTTDENFPMGHPQLAQVAIQQGRLLAKNLERLAVIRIPLAFRYNNKGSMAIIAKYKAVVDLPGGFFKDRFAWFTWLFIHIIPIASFRNKVKLAYNWFWSFTTNDPTLRLIIRPKNKK